MEKFCIKSKRRNPKPNRLTGQQYDQATQQYYQKQGIITQQSGRFTQEDVYRGDGLNLYTYCENNPVMYYDPSGYLSKKPYLRVPKDVIANRAKEQRLAGSEEVEVPFRYDLQLFASKEVRGSLSLMQKKDQI